MTDAERLSVIEELLARWVRGGRIHLDDEAYAWQDELRSRLGRPVLVTGVRSRTTEPAPPLEAEFPEYDAEETPTQVEGKRSA